MMDRRSWLWRRKSPDKSPGGETESSGSLSSLSERFLDDQTLSNLITHPTEDITKAASADEHECSNTIEALSKKLADALLDVQAKEDLVKQHAKVAEEAVSGWEKTESEVLVLKQENDSLMQKNSLLEERVGHLDGALKECLRQLRQSREEQQSKIRDAAVEKTREWELLKSEFEKQLAELHTQLQNANLEANLAADALSKLDSAENENLILRDTLLSRTKELELRTREKDLSIHAAEIASRQHLDSIRRVAKLEAACRGLKLLLQKTTGNNNQCPVAMSSTHVEQISETLIDGVQIIKSEGSKMNGAESDYELLHPNTTLSSLAMNPGQRRCERTHSSIIPPVDIYLMDDFLAMERLAALQGSHSGTASRDEVEAVVGNRVVELEETLKKMKSEKENLEIALDESRIQLQASKDRLKQTEAKLVELKTQLALANEAKRNSQKQCEYTTAELQSTTNRLCEAEANVLKIQGHLAKANEEKKNLEDKLTEGGEKREEAESRLRIMDHELETLRFNICALEKELEKERILSGEAANKANRLEAELLRMKLDLGYRRPAAAADEFRNHQDQKMAAEAASKFAECQKTIASLTRQLKSLATFEDLQVNSDRSVAVL